MSSFDLFREMSALDEKLVMKPRKFVSLIMNFLLCLAAAGISSFAKDVGAARSLAVYFGSFFALYALMTWLMNRRKNRKLLNEK